MDETQRLKLCRLIAGIIVSDDDLDENEDKFIDRMLAKFGIPASEREAIFPIVDRSEAADEIKSLPAAVQREALDLLVEAACADGKVVAEERAYLHTVAEAIEVPHAEIDALIDKMLGASAV